MKQHVVNYIEMKKNGKQVQWKDNKRNLHFLPQIVLSLKNILWLKRKNESQC